eukprot:4570669-Amphidinium_carterae.1
MRLASVMVDGGVPHPYLVQLLAYVPERCGIVMELCEGDLLWFRSEGPGVWLHASEQVELMEKAAIGCCWIAEKHLVHRDLKMQNILVAKTQAGSESRYVPKIADFGLAEQRTSLRMGREGTLAYMAPEAHDGCCSEKSDVFSFGHVMIGTYCASSEYL